MWSSDMLRVVIVVLVSCCVVSAEPVTDRGDRAIFTIRVDQKGSSYIIHPDLSRLEAEALLLGPKINSTSFFYNVTGLAGEVDAGRASPPYQTTASANPASKLLLEALLHNINADKSRPTPSMEESTLRDAEYVVHNGDAISVEDVTHKVFHAATNRVSAHHHPLLGPLVNAHKPEQLIPSSLVKAPRPATSATTLRTTTPLRTTTTTTRKTTPPTTTTKRTEDPNLRRINSPPEEEQEVYDEEYEEYEEEEEEATSSTAGTTTTTLLRSTSRPSTLPATNKAIKPQSSTSSTTIIPARKPATTSPVGITYIPLNSVTNKNGILTIAKLNNATSAVPPPSSRLPEYTIKTGVSSVSLDKGSASVGSGSLVTKSNDQKTTTKPTTTKTTTTAEPFELSDFLVRVAGEASEILMEPSAPDRNVPSTIDGSIFGTLFSQDKKRTRPEPVAAGIRPGSRPDSPLIPHQPPTPQRGSVHNLHRPNLFSALNQQPPTAQLKPQVASRVIRPVELGKYARTDEIGHHTTPNTDALLSLYSSPGLVTQSPADVDVITAPSQWNLIVSSSLQSSATGQKSAGHQQSRVPVPSSSLSHRHGYIIDEVEAVDSPEAVRVPVGSDGLLQHQDSPSRLGVAIDYDEPKTAQSGRPPAGGASDYVSYEDYEDYAEEQPPATTTNRTTTLLFDRKKLVLPEHPQSKPPPFPYGVNSGDITDEEPSPAGASSSEELEGFGAAFPEVISNSVRRAGAPAAPSVQYTQPPRHYLDVEEKRPEVFHTEQAIDAFDKKFRTVEVNADMPVNTTTIPHDEPATSGSGGLSELSGAALTYILIGTFGGLSLLFLCAVGITIRCRKRRFMFSTFTATLMRRSDQRRVAADEESQSGSPNALSGRRLANQQLAAGSGKESGEVATHKLGSWFTGRNSMSSLHSGSQVSGTRKLRSEVALPRTTPNTPGGRASSSGTRKVVTTRAYFTDGRTGSTRDLITSTTGSSDSSGAETPVHSPGSPHPPDRNSWLHTSYKDRGNSLSELRDSSFYCITQADAASSDGERPRSTSATVRSPLHHFRSTEDLDSIDATPPDLPPKRQQRFSVGDSMSMTVDPMGSHLTIQTEASASNWGTVEDRLI